MVNKIFYKLILPWLVDIDY